MAATAGSLDLQRPFTYVFEDKDWIKKVLIGGAVFWASGLFCILLVGLAGLFLLMGYQRRVALAVADGQELPLPDLFLNVGDDMMVGLKMFVITLGWAVPGMIIQILRVALIFIGFAISEEAATVAMILSTALLCVAFPVSIAGGLFGLLGIFRFWETGELGAGFQYREIWAFLKRQWVNVLLALVVGAAAGLAAFLAGGLLFCVGMYFTLFWAQFLVQGHAFGQLLKIDRAARTAG